MAMADALNALGAVRQTSGQILAAMRQEMAAANRLGFIGALLLLVPVAGITLRLYGSRPAALRSAGAPLSVLVFGALLVAANALAARLPARRVLGHLARLEQLKPREAAPPPAEAQPPPEAAAVAAPSPAAPRMRVIDTVAPVEISPESEGGASGGMEEGLAGGVEGGVLGGVVGGVIGAPMEVPGTVQVTPPERISGPQPAYTEAAREARIQGTVVLEAAIDEHGDVTDVRVLRGLPLGLDRAAADAVKKWKFKPALREGEPVAATKVIPVAFRISSP
jgi:protein TonB